uniref:Uncharacterized protein n=1 Tax=Buteo japonicus TaxID=224669 RepID=A0A8B9Z7R1_9AVES
GVGGRGWESRRPLGVRGEMVLTCSGRIVSVLLEKLLVSVTVTLPNTRSCRLTGKKYSWVSRNAPALCKSERARVMEKQKYAPVWTLRKSPPPEWYLPLDQDKQN